MCPGLKLSPLAVLHPQQHKPKLTHHIDIGNGVQESSQTSGLSHLTFRRCSKYKPWLQRSTESTSQRARKHRSLPPAPIASVLHQQLVVHRCATSQHARPARLLIARIVQDQAGAFGRQCHEDCCGAEW
jgi:hypothetical protein